MAAGELRIDAAVRAKESELAELRSIQARLRTSAAPPPDVVGLSQLGHVAVERGHYCALSTLAAGGGPCKSVPGISFSQSRSAAAGPEHDKGFVIEDPGAGGGFLGFFGLVEGFSSVVSNCASAAAAAAYVREYFHGAFVEQSKGDSVFRAAAAADGLTGKTSTALYAAILQLDAWLLSKLELQDAGVAGAFLVVVSPSAPMPGAPMVCKRVTVGNIGNVQAVLALRGGGPARILSHLHSTSVEAEVYEARRRGVWIERDGAGQLLAGGILPYTRSLGDAALRRVARLLPAPWVHSFDVSPETDFIILATHGIADVLTPDAMVEAVRVHRASGLLLKDTSQAVFDLRARGAVDHADDDSAVLVIFF